STVPYSVELFIAEAPASCGCDTHVTLAIGITVACRRMNREVTGKGICFHKHRQLPVLLPTAGWGLARTLFAG
ncbi:hypothetical protein, partial [Acinetobacter baumannii]|uniref:hypothetical protein n=1 Tax=Acinetobacter baumannii TaxID=470 RepID=UPI001C07FB55